MPLTQVMSQLNMSMAATQPGSEAFSPCSHGLGTRQNGRLITRKLQGRHKVVAAAVLLLVMALLSHQALLSPLLGCPGAAPSSHAAGATARFLGDAGGEDVGNCPPQQSRGGPANFSSDFGDLPPGCVHLTDVCADQSQLVLYSPLYRPEAYPKQKKLPSFVPDSKYNFPWISGSNPDPLMIEEVSLPPPVFRPASAREGSPDLQDPVFADGVVPLVLYPTWPENYGHTIGNHLGWLYTHIANSSTPWKKHVMLKLATPYGLAYPAHWPSLLKPLNLEHVETFADFSARGPPSPCRSRCFRHMLLCPADSMKHTTNSWQAAQYVAEWYGPHLPPLPFQYLPPANSSAGNPQEGTQGSAGEGADVEKGASDGGGSGGDADQRSVLQRSSSSSGGGSSGWGKGQQEPPQVLRVLISRREGNAVRQLSNLEELLEACRGWRHTVPATGRAYVASCGSWEFQDLETSITAAQSADVLVGTHGATIMNSFFMRPGSSVVELFPPAWIWDIHRIWISTDPKAQLQWWGLIVKDADAYTPGALELQAEKTPGLYRGDAGPYKKQRDRNMRVPWEGIAAILRQVAAVRGNATAYQETVEAHRNQYMATPKGVSAIKGPWPEACLLWPRYYSPALKLKYAKKLKKYCDP